MTHVGPVVQMSIVVLTARNMKKRHLTSAENHRRKKFRLKIGEIFVIISG